MQRHRLIGTALCSGMLAVWGAYAGAEEFSARLDSFQELGALNNQTGAILSDGTGTLRLNLDRKSKMAAYILTYNNVGTTPPLTGTVTVAHIHFGKNHASGGVLVFFCSTAALPATFTGPTPPACTDHDGTFRGTFTAANVQAVPTQNVVAMDFDALADAIESNTAYANIHTTALPAGEIRGQVHRGDRDEHHDNHDNHEHK
jgi:hypothetical protein